MLRKLSVAGWYRLIQCIILRIDSCEGLEERSRNRSYFYRLQNSKHGNFKFNNDDSVLVKPIWFEFLMYT